MEYRSTQRGFSTQNNHVPPILSVRSQAFHAVTVHLPRGGRGPPAQYRRSSRRQPASNTRRHDTGKGEAAASLAPALAVGGHEPVPGTIAQQIQLAAHAADNRRQRCVREHSAAPQLGPLPPPIPAATYFPAMTPAPARRRRRPRSPVLCLRPGPVWRPGTRTQGTRTQVRARGVARERAHPGPTCNPRARPGGSVPPPPAQRPPPRARRAPAGGYITPPLSSSSFSSRRRGAGTGPRPRAQGGAEAAGPAAPGRPHAAPGGHGAAPRGEWEAAAAARSPSAASQTSIPGRRRLRLPRRGFTSRLPPAQGARNRLLPASLSLAALSPLSPLSLPSFLPPPPPLGVPGSGPSSPRPSCERVTRESRATNRRSVNKRRAPGGPARPHPAQPADEAPPAGRHPALRHRRERRGSAGSRARDGGAGRAAPAPLRLPPPGRAAGAAGLWRPLAALCGEDGRAARGAAPRCGAAGGAWVGLGRPGSVPPNRPLLALVEIGVPVCSCCVLVAEIIGRRGPKVIKFTC